MRGGDRFDDFVTTDLLAVWTDPDTAMEAVGAGLGIFTEPVPDVRRALATDSPLRRTLYAALLDLVEGGALEKRATVDGRYAFRCREDVASTAFLVDIDLTVEPELEIAAAPVLGPGPDTEIEIADVEGATPRAETARLWPRVVVPAAPLLFPAISCIVAIVAFVWLDRAGGLLIAAALTVIGVVGLLRRVPFAGLWIMGVLVAGLVLRFS